MNLSLIEKQGRHRHSVGRVAELEVVRCKKSKKQGPNGSTTHMKTILAIASILLAIGFLTESKATSYAPPQDRVVESPNGKYALNINAKTNRHEIRKGTEILWSFERSIWQDEFYLSNDGQRVLWIAWEHVQVADGKGWRNRQADVEQQEEAVVVYSPDGVLLKKTFAEVSIPVKPVGPGPIGDFWRVWRGTKITQKDDVISIAVKGKNEEFTIDLSKIKKLLEAERGDAGQPATRPRKDI